MPPTLERFTDQALTIEVAEEAGELLMRWLGRSTARDPRVFLTPILQHALAVSVEVSKPLVLDFRRLEYLNSSTITPVLRLLDKARLDSARVILRYREDLRWQHLNFSALKVLEGGSGAITIEGVRG